MAGATPSPAEQARRLAEQALEVLAGGNLAEAERLGTLLLSGRPRSVQAHLVSGLCHERRGDTAGAEAAFKAGLKLDRGDPDLAMALADLLEAAGRPGEAETSLRAALQANRRSAKLVARLARSLTASGRAEAALLVTARLAADAAPDHGVLTEQASAEKALGRPEKAVAIHERAARLFPDSAVAHHNLAADRGDMGQFAASESSAARALAKGGQAPQTWLVYARALMGQNKLDQAERAFQEAIRRDPGYVVAHRDLAQLVWMRRGDAEAALAVLDRTIGSGPPPPALIGLRANVLHYAGAWAPGYATLLEGLRLYPDDLPLCLAAAELAALCGQTQAAMAHATKAVTLRPGDEAAGYALYGACMAAGDAAQASTIAAAMVARNPWSQRALAYQATAWRLLGDERYGALYDYASFVRAWRMDVPDGWDNLEAYLADLGAVLEGMHPFLAHPLDQSLRHGSQASHLLTSDNPVIRAFFRAVEGPIRRHLAEMGPGADQLRARGKGGFRFAGAWSVRLRPGGFHADHIHSQGWISSACYIALPAAAGRGREAWIKFGEPGIPTSPALGAEHFIEPQPGMLVLFPSYMWHGTVPFSAGGERLSVAFDLVPG